MLLCWCRATVPGVLALGLVTASPVTAAEPLRAGGTGAALGIFKRLAEGYRTSHGALRLELSKSLGSGGGIRAVAAGALDIGLSSRPLKAKEALARVRVTPFAHTPFVLVASARPRVARLTSAQVRNIFTGRQDRWADGAAIRLVLRPASDSDSEILVRRFFSGNRDPLDALRRRRGFPVAPTDQDAADLAERAPGALTTSTQALIRSEGRNLTPVVIDGVAPTLENLERGIYPAHKVLYLVLRPDVPARARRFVDYIYTRDGARILRRYGCLPVQRPARS